MGAHHGGHPINVVSSGLGGKTAVLSGGCQRSHTAVAVLGTRRGLGFPLQRVWMDVARRANRFGRFCELPRMDVAAGPVSGNANFRLCVLDARIRIAIRCRLAERAGNAVARHRAGTCCGRHCARQSQAVKLATLRRCGLAAR